jgi:hypothetical protein
MHLLIFGNWMTVSDYNTNPTVIILVVIGILSSWDWNVNAIILVGLKKTFV